MLRATLKSLLSHKLRLLLSGLAVVLGVMFVSGALILTDTIGRSFDQLLGTAYDDVDVVVTGEELGAGGGGVPEGTPIPGSVVTDLAALPEVDDDPRAEVVAIGAKAIDNRNGKVVSTFSLRIGTNWVGENALTQLREGEGPDRDDEVAINSTLARTGGFTVGDPITVRVPRREEPLSFTVVGIFGYAGGRDSLFGETHVAFTTPVAQELMLGQGDVYTEVSLFASGDTTPEQLRDLVAAEVGDDYQVRTGAQAAAEQSDEIREQLSFLNYVLLGFAGVALFVGIFLVLNTFSIIVAQRLRELALLRAVGASRRQMVGSVLLEAAIIGLLASVGGLLLGIGVGGLLAFVLDVAPGGGIGVPASAVAASFAVGLLVTLVAALLPALRAARVPPVAAMQEAAAPDRSLARLSVAGAVVTLAAAAALAVSLTGNAGDATLALLLAGVLLAFVGVALLTPLVARPVTSALGRMFAWSVPGTLGRRNTGRNPRRTAITAAALMVGVALVTGVSTVFSSLSTSFGSTIENDLDAELVIAGEWTSATPPTFDAGVPDAARQLPDVAAVAALWYDALSPTELVIAVDDSTAWRDIAGIVTVDGSLAGLAGGEVVVDDRTAEQDGLAVGDTVPVQLPRAGERGYTLVGVYERVPNLVQGYVFSAEDADGFRSVNPVAAYVDVRDGTDVAGVRGELERLTASSPEVLVQDRSGYIEQQTRAFDQVLVFIQVLLVLAMVIAVLGVVNTLVLSVIERTRELGLLRAVGLGRGATARMVTVESVVISLFGALLGIGVGVALGAAAVYALREEGLTHLTFPWVLMAVYLVLAALVGVAAAVIPAIRAARLNVLAAIAYE
jgi:putative ABC transport system permease protein